MKKDFYDSIKSLYCSKNQISTELNEDEVIILKNKFKWYRPTEPLKKIKLYIVSKNLPTPALNNMKKFAEIIAA